MQTLPIHLDVFAFVILLGVAQGVFLGVFFLTGSRGKQVANPCLGWLMLGLSAIIGEIFLNYSNYMFRVLWLVNFAEPFNFLLGPLFYFFVFSRVRQQLPHRWGWHVLPFGIWVVNAATWLYQPVAFKYNSYVGSLHPELPNVPQRLYWAEDFTGLRGYVNELTLLSCVVYAVLALWLLQNTSRQDAGYWPSANRNVLRLLSWLFALVPILIIIVKLQFQEDLGDYLLACYLTGIIYATSFLVMRGSSFFGDETQRPVMEPPTPAAESLIEPKKKYEKSSLSEEVEDAVLTPADASANHRKAVSATGHFAAQTGPATQHKPTPPVATAQRPAGAKFLRLVSQPPYRRGSASAERPHHGEPQNRRDCRTRWVQFTLGVPHGVQATDEPDTRSVSGEPAGRPRSAAVGLSSHGLR